MIPAMAVAAVVGTGMQIYGSIKEGQAREDAANQQAAMNDLEAGEVMRRANVQDRNILRTGQEFISEQKANQWGDLGGSSLTLYDDTMTKIADQRAEAMQEATFRASQLRTQGSLEQMQGAAAANAGYLTATAAAFNGASNFASTFGPKQANQKWGST